MFVSSDQLESALGEFKNQDQSRFYAEMCKIFQPLEAPKPGDWLSGSKQAHQSFANYRLPFYNPVTPERRTIYILQFDEFDQGFMHQLCNFCRIFYSTLDVKCLPRVQFEKQLGKIRKREGYYRNQYRAQDILEYMQKRVPNDAYCIMGITLQDIYPADSWLFAYGWAKYKARVGIFSFLRFDQLYARKKTQKIDWEIILYPSMRTMAHEIGHMFGVTHCVYYRCLMNGFNGIQENYTKPFEFCPICFRKISTNIKFDLASRYRQLLNYCNESKIILLKKDMQKFKELLQLSIQFPIKLISEVYFNKPIEPNQGTKEQIGFKSRQLPKSQSVMKNSKYTAKIPQNESKKIASKPAQKQKINQGLIKKQGTVNMTKVRAASLYGKYEKIKK